LSCLLLLLLLLLLHPVHPKHVSQSAIWTQSLYIVDRLVDHVGHHVGPRDDATDCP